MAEEQEKEEEKKEEGAEKKSNMMLIIIAGFLVVLLVIGGILAFILSSDEEQQQQNNSVQNESNSNNENGQPTKTYRRKSSLTVGPMMEMDTFIVNLLSENGRRYLKVKVNLELEDEELQEEIGTKIPVLRDVIIRIASSKTLAEISTEKGKENFKDQIVSEVNENLKDGKINNVFFTDFVIQ
jgi:flagellar FliL protein